MNARTNTFEIACEGHQVAEVVASIFQSILLHRTYGKFTYKQEQSYSIGTLGYEEVACDFIDFSYVRCASPTFVEKVNLNIREFVERLRANDQNQQGIVSLEFFTRKRGRLNLMENPIWEVWTLVMDCGNRSTERLEDVLLEKITSIIQIVNKAYLPPMPSESTLDNVFDTTYSDVQPYLHKINYKLGTNRAGQSSPANAVPSTIMKIFREALS